MQWPIEISTQSNDLLASECMNLRRGRGQAWGERPRAVAPFDRKKADRRGTKCFCQFSMQRHSARGNGGQPLCSHGHDSFSTMPRESVSIESVLRREGVECVHTQQLCLSRPVLPSLRSVDSQNAFSAFYLFIFFCNRIL